MPEGFLSSEGGGGGKGGGWIARGEGQVEESVIFYVRRELNYM